MRVDAQDVVVVAGRLVWTGRRGRAARSGVTLLELLVVVVLMGLLATVALPRLADSAVWVREGETSARQVAGTLHLARRMAVEGAADNAIGYALDCAKQSYRLINMATFESGEEIFLADGWRFEETDYTVLLDPYGGARLTSGSGTALALYKGEKRYLVRFDPATGYVWCEGG